MLRMKKGFNQDDGHSKNDDDDQNQTMSENYLSLSTSPSQSTSPSSYEATLDYQTPSKPSNHQQNSASKTILRSRKKTPKKNKTSLTEKTPSSSPPPPPPPPAQNTNQNEIENTSDNKLNQIISSFLISIKTFSRILLSPIIWLASLIMPHAIGISLAVISLGIIIYAIKSYLGLFYNQFFTIDSSYYSLMISRSFEPITKAVSGTILPFMISIPCTVLPASICGNYSHSRNYHTNIQLAEISRTVSKTAKKSSDIFESVIKLSNPTDLGLHQTEIWELSFAVRWSTENLETSDILADQLFELGHLTRDVKDKMMDLNSEGINTFSSIAHEFSRISDLIELVQKKKRYYGKDTITKNLDLLFENLSQDLTNLLNSIESSIPLVSRSSNLGLKISERLLKEKVKLLKLKNKDQGFFKILLIFEDLKDKILTSSKSRQISKDLSLTDLSIRNLKDTWMRLEDVRSDLVNYRNNLAYFKASLSGWHLADHGLTPEDELYSLRFVIRDFQDTISKVKAVSRFNYQNHSNNKNNIKQVEQNIGNGNSEIESGEN